MKVKVKVTGRPFTGLETERPVEASFPSLFPLPTYSYLLYFLLRTSIFKHIHIQASKHPSIHNR